MSLVVMMKVPQNGEPHKLAVNKNNILEVSEKDKETSWLKYWDGNGVRSTIIKGSPLQVAQACK